MLELQELAWVVVLLDGRSAQGRSQDVGAAARLAGVERFVENLLAELGQLEEARSSRGTHCVRYPAGQER